MTVTDEPEFLPWGELSLVNGDHSARVFLRLQFSLSDLFWQLLHRGPRLRTITHNVFVSYLKNWQRSQITPIIHISGFWNSCTLKASHDCISFRCQWEWFTAPALQSVSHSKSRPVLVLGRTLLTLVTTSRLCWCWESRQTSGCHV